MSSQANRLFLVFRNSAGVVHEEELDFGALVHDVAFSAVCSGQLPNDGRWEPVETNPDWVDGRLRAITVRVAGCSREYGRGVFKDRALEVLVTRGFLADLASDAEVAMSWDVEARKADTDARGGRRRASIRHQPYPLVTRDPGVPGEHIRALSDEIPSISVSASLLAELREESVRSLDRERADFLAGHLAQEPDGRVTVDLRSRIPADTESAGSLARFSFSSRTFEAAQRELELRRSDHVILGWHHNHPPLCGRSCLMRIPACATGNGLFSVDDRVVHRSAFSRPFMVALVSGKAANRRADDPAIRAFGWRRGLICERAWLVV